MTWLSENWLLVLAIGGFLLLLLRGGGMMGCGMGARGGRVGAVSAAVMHGRARAVAQQPLLLTPRTKYVASPRTVRQRRVRDPIDHRRTRR